MAPLLQQPDKKQYINEQHRANSTTIVFRARKSEVMCFELSTAYFPLPEPVISYLDYHVNGAYTLEARAILYYTSTNVFFIGC